MCRQAFQIDWPFILSSIESIDNKQLLSVLEEVTNYGQKITEIVDDKNFNLLHHAVLKGFHGKINFLIENALKLEKCSD